MIEGNPGDSILEDRNSMVLSKEIANKIFPGENPIGKEIKGIIVIKSQPTIKSYKEVKIISSEEILNL
jgi:hypothetical protein